MTSPRRSPHAHRRPPHRPRVGSFCRAAQISCLVACLSGGCASAPDIDRSADERASLAVARATHEAYLGAERHHLREVRPVLTALEDFVMTSPLLESAVVALRGSEETWVLPDIGQPEPPFPYLPGEDRRATRSIGDVAYGYLVRGRVVPMPHPHMAFLEVQYQRGLFYTSDEMIQLVEDGAANVHRHHRDSTLYLGNFGAKGGGDIPYSVSHNSGRDADLAFYLLDEEGAPAVAPDLLELDRRGRYRGEHGNFSFDVERNWRLVEGLLTSEAATIEKIFVANWLRRDLLEEARRVGADSALVDRAQDVLRQPTASLPHNDHFHVRILCSERDARSGCRDTSAWKGYSKLHREARRETIARARELLEDERAWVRRNAALRLAMMRSRRSARDIVALLDDDAPEVRAAAARALADLGRYSYRLARRLRREEHPHVAAELIDGLRRFGGKWGLRGLTRMLRREFHTTLARAVSLDLRVFAVDALGFAEEPEAVESLVEMLESRDPELRVHAARALHYLTNHRIYDELDDWREPNRWRRRKMVEKWRTWLEEHGEETRDEWLAAGFRQAGYDVPDMSVQSVWELTLAVLDADPLSYNAQRALMELSGKEPASLQWSRHDASWYWRRHFRRRRKRYGAPAFDATDFFRRAKRLEGWSEPDDGD